MISLREPAKDRDTHRQTFFSSVVSKEYYKFMMGVFLAEIIKR